jgi:NAD(P)-dependent dehydrogenase (short-subunit alcohol dehydrogenase family)
VGLLEGKTALITGGSTGIGLATAVRLADEGAHLFITGRRKTELDTAVEVIGPAATAVTGDISDLADLDRLYDTIRSRGQGLDVLFANASIASLVPLEQVTEEHFDTLFCVNVRGTLFTVQKALPLLNNGASVIVNGSTNRTSAMRRSACTRRPRPPSGRSSGPGSTNSKNAASGSTPSRPARPTLLPFPR